MKKTARNIYLGLILFLMYAPIVTLIVLSFNVSKSRAKWGGFTLHWYSSLFQDKAIMAALYNTLLIALVSAILATIIGTAASIGINAMKAKGKTIMMGITNIPILNSEIVTGISLMLLFIACRVTLGFSTILLAHITFCIPYVGQSNYGSSLQHAFDCPCFCHSCNYYRYGCLHRHQCHESKMQDYYDGNYQHS